MTSVFLCLSKGLKELKFKLKEKKSFSLQNFRKFGLHIQSFSKCLCNGNSTIVPITKQNKSVHTENPDILTMHPSRKLHPKSLFLSYEQNSRINELPPGN